MALFSVDLRSPRLGLGTHRLINGTNESKKDARVFFLLALPRFQDAALDRSGSYYPAIGKQSVLKSEESAVLVTTDNFAFPNSV